jgi:hypothetical protein
METVIPYQSLLQGFSTSLKLLPLSECVIFLTRLLFCEVRPAISQFP